MGKLKAKETWPFFMPKNRKERTEKNVKIIYVWYILGRNRATAVECFQSFLSMVEFLDILGIRPTTIYFINRVRASMLMVPNFQPRKSGIVINNYFNCQGGVKGCNCNVINVNKGWDKCGYIASDFKIKFFKGLFLYLD